MQHALILENVSIGYGGEHRTVLRGVNLAVAAGERVALLGLNGSGKTTLLYAAAGLLPHEGTISVCGLTLDKRNARTIRDGIGFLFSIPEDQIFFPRIIDDTAFGLRRRGVPEKNAVERAQKKLERLGVGHAGNLSPFHCSHGQRQRVALAGALVGNPRLLLLDEPSSSLDPPGKKTLADTLCSLGAAMLIATHDIVFAQSVCKRFAVIEEGRIAYDGTDVSRASGFLESTRRLP
jgi:cobalt/nickel transport system ATP-binding protein